MSKPLQRAPDVPTDGDTMTVADRSGTQRTMVYRKANDSFESTIDVVGHDGTETLRAWLPRTLVTIIGRADAGAVGS